MEQTTFTPLLSRKLIKPQDVSSTGSQETFSVLQWNTLASHLDTPDSFPKINPDYLLKTYRQPLMVKEIQAFAPDFVCMEEVHNSDVEFFKSIYPKYACIFHSKHQGEDGLCFLYNQDKFEIVKSELQSYIDENGAKQSQVFQVNIFKLKTEEASKNDYVMVAFTHLKAKGPNVAIRVGQVKQLVQFIDEKKKQFIESQTEASTKLGLVVCGDFNDEPQSEPLKYLEEHTQLKTAFAGETYTTFKIREKAYKRVIDYIYYSDNLSLLEKSNIPVAEEVIGELGLPNADYPSDHLSLFCRFEFK